MRDRKAGTTPSLRYVDASAPRGALYRGYARLVGTRPVGWLSQKIVWKVDPWLLRVTGGRIGAGLLLPTALLETRGARTGQRRANGIIYFPADSRERLARELSLPWRRWRGTLTIQLDPRSDR
jgi:hypothetical protein